MLIRFAVSRPGGWVEFDREVTARQMEAYEDLPHSYCERIRWWGDVLDDVRFRGARALIWEPVPRN